MASDAGKFQFSDTELAEFKQVFDSFDNDGNHKQDDSHQTATIHRQALSLFGWHCALLEASGFLPFHEVRDAIDQGCSPNPPPKRPLGTAPHDLDRGTGGSVSE